MYMKYIDLLSVESLNRERERERKSVQMKVFLNDFLLDAFLGGIWWSTCTIIVYLFWDKERTSIFLN